jgi:F420-non-reducing hydrogenase iron-sulfur subunit
VEPEFIAEALIRGADGVFIGGCHFGDCHYKEGNYKSIRRFNLFKRVATELGVEPDRIQLEWISGSEGKKFAESMTDFDAKIRELGPNPLKGGAQ